MIISIDLSSMVFGLLLPFWIALSICIALEEQTLQQLTTQNQYCLNELEKENGVIKK